LNSHRIASHLISFALQHFVSPLRFALKENCESSFSLIESKCCSDRRQQQQLSSKCEWRCEKTFPLRQRGVCVIFQAAEETHVSMAVCLKMALVKSATAATDNDSNIEKAATSRIAASH